MGESVQHVDFIVPAFNEGLGIRDTLQSMLTQTFHDPFRVHVKVIANNCHDDTAVIAESQQSAFELHPNLTLEVFDTPIVGKQRALNYGLEQSEESSVLIGDADIRYGNGCLETVINNLNHPATWITAPMSAPLLPNRPTTMLEQVQLLRQIGREEDTKTAPNGALIGFKRAAIESFPTNIASEDTWLSLVVAREYGWSAIDVDSTVNAYFKSPSNWPDFFRQEARFLRGTRQLLEVNPDLATVMTLGDSRRLPENELHKRVAERWVNMGFSLDTLSYANSVLPSQIEETYAALKDVLIRPDFTWDQSSTTKKY